MVFSRPHRLSLWPIQSLRSSLCTWPPRISNTSTRMAKIDSGSLVLDTVCEVSVSHVPTPSAIVCGMLRFVADQIFESVCHRQSVSASKAYSGEIDTHFTLTNFVESDAKGKRSRRAEATIPVDSLIARCLQNVALKRVSSTHIIRLTSLFISSTTKYQLT